MELRFENLDMGSLHPLVYYDASFATNDEFSYQIGYVILKFDEKNLFMFFNMKSVSRLGWYSSNG